MNQRKSTWSQLETNMDLEIMQAYSDCGGESLLVTMGSKVNSLSGFVSSVVNTGYQLTYMVLDTNWQQKIVDAINVANMDQDAEEWKMAGYYVGSIFAALLEYRVPSTSFVYGETLVSEVLAAVTAEEST